MPRLDAYSRGPWLADAVGDHLLFIAVAMICGFLGMGAIAERLGRIGVSTIHVAFTGMTVFAVVQIALVFQWTGAVLPTWMLFGFFGASGILSYAALPRGFPPALAGRVITGLNVLTFAGAFAAQWGIGVIINLWPATSDGGYASEGYQAAFAMMLGLQVLALAWFVVYRKGKV